MKIQNVGIFGGADTSANSHLFKDVKEVAKTLVKSGYRIVNGGGPGVMLAATEGAEKEGINGNTLGVLLDIKDAPGFEGKYTKNETDWSIRTTNYLDRMKGLINNSDCFVIFNGGTGTLSEFATTWCMARLYYGQHKPLILYGDFWHEIIDVVVNNMMVRGTELKVFKIVNSPKEVMNAIKEFTKK